jgi:hypothetical protein
MISDYGKVYTVGHRDIRRLFDGPVVVQEKIDGSQFSAMCTDIGVLIVRSKGNYLDPVIDREKGLFAPSIRHLITVKDKMVPFGVYRFEAISRPKHNVLAYERVPAGNLVLYDLKFNNVLDAGHEMLEEQAEELGVEPVQEIYIGETSESALADYLIAKPMLGGAMMEGIVIKNYVLGLKGKLVAPRFQEIMHGRPPKTPRESPITDLGRKYCSEARWEKAIAHLREAGAIGPEPARSDVGLIIKEVQRDVIEEYGADIRDELFTAYAKSLRGEWIKGLPEWYLRQC